MDVVLIRHAQPAVEPGVCYGRLDVPLLHPLTPAPDAMLTSARSAAAAAGVVAPRVIVSSPARRAVDTAAALAAVWHAGDGNGLGVAREPRLRELDFGRWEGLRWDAIPRDELDEWAADLHGARPHGGETAREAMARVTAWADSLRGAAEASATSVWAVCHAGPMRLLAAHWLGLPVAATIGWPLQWGASCAVRLGASAGQPPQLLWWNRGPV